MLKLLCTCVCMCVCDLPFIDTQHQLISSCLQWHHLWAGTGSLGTFAPSASDPSHLQVEAEGEVLALFCGREQTDTEAVPAKQVMTSPTNSLSVVFASDFSNEEKFSGFLAHYSAVGVSDIPVCMFPQHQSE